MTSSLDLLFRDAPVFGLKDAPSIQSAKIYVKSHTTYVLEGRNKLDFITSECVSLGGLEGEIDRLHAELDDIRKMARQRFAAADQKTVNGELRKVALQISPIYARGLAGVAQTVD